MKDGSSPRQLGSSFIFLFPVPVVCGVALVAAWLGVVTIPYLGFSSPQQLVIQEGAGTNILSSSSPPVSAAAPVPSTAAAAFPRFRHCDVFQGKWVYDPGAGAPLYSSGSCPILSAAQNCEANGRPDKEYLLWRWAPDACDLPRFNTTAFLQLMRGKLLAFVGDSVTRNHMESLMCILLQVETPINKGNKKMQRWFFPSYSTTIVRIWSSWLVRTTQEVAQTQAQGNTVPPDASKLEIDQVDDKFAEFLSKVDVLVISSGHWFVKKSAYILGGKVVGTQGWRKPGLQLGMNNVAAFTICMRTALQAIVSHPSYRGLTIFRTYSPDHYEGGGWNTGGSCTGQMRPLHHPLDNRFTSLLRRIQLDELRNAEKNVTNGSRLRVMDITPAFAYRADGHPGPYRNQDPSKKTLPDAKGHPPPQDCLHWCMPGPVDTWNDFLFHILGQEFGTSDQ